MDESLTNEPVSAATPAFRDLLARTFADSGFVILLLRYAYCAGAKDYFVARSIQEFDEAMKLARAKTSITVFFEGNFTLSGIADDKLCAKAIELLPSTMSEYEGIDVIRVDGATIELVGDQFSYLTTPEEIREWFVTSHGARVVVGTLKFWHDNCPQIVTVYVPDEDGVVRPGAY